MKLKVVWIGILILRMSCELCKRTDHVLAQCSSPRFHVILNRMNTLLIEGGGNRETLNLTLMMNTKTELKIAALYCHTSMSGNKTDIIDRLVQFAWMRHRPAPLQVLLPTQQQVIVIEEEPQTPPHSPPRRVVENIKMYCSSSMYVMADEECSICFGKTYIQTQCGHSFCQCIIQHIGVKIQAGCPMCRENIRELYFCQPVYYNVLKSAAGILKGRFTFVS